MKKENEGLDWSDDELRDALRAHIPESPEAPCPTSPETLWALAEGSLAPEEARSVVDHMSKCPACAEDFRITREMLAESGESTAAPVVAFPSRKARRARLDPRIFALAASVLIAVGAVWLSSRDLPKDPPYRRQAGDEPQIASVIGDGASVPRAAVRLEWTELPGARYDVVVTTESLDIVTEEVSLDQSFLAIAPEDLLAVPADTPLLWHVEAILPDGRRVASPVFKVFLLEDE